jgi:hypothetical protein
MPSAKTDAEYWWYLRFLLFLGLSLSSIAVAGCETTAGTVVLATAGATVAGSYSPNNEIQQVYYVGIFDPQEQLPTAVYRITVHGQSSFISDTKFASGWVPAAFADSLDTRIGFNDAGALTMEGKGGAGVATGRRLMMFGPEGFREAPRDHRLCIVMGSSPQKFFDAVSNGLETIAEVTAEQTTSAATNLILKEMLRLKDERQKLREVNASMESDTTTPSMQ